MVTIPSTAAYKPWTYTTSSGVLDGLINGGAYIRGAYIRGTYNWNTKTVSRCLYTKAKLTSSVFAV